MDATAAQPVREDLILIVDDDFQIQRLLSRDLTRLGYSIAQARSGLEGLTLVETAHPALIMLDLRMPAMDGHTFLRRLRKNMFDTAVIVMSGAGEMEDVVDVLRLGALDFLKKPWTLGELTAAINRAMTVGKLRRTAAGSTVAAPDDAARRRAADSTLPDLATGGADNSMVRIAQEVREGKVPLPSAPSVIHDLRTLLARPDTPLDSVVTLLARDQRLAVDVLRLSNTPDLIRVHGRNHDLKVAVQRIGMQRIGGLVETICLNRLTRVADPKFRELLLTLWRHSLARAIAMRAIAEVAAQDLRPNPEIAYVAGLLADVGASFLIAVMAERGGSAAFNVDEKLFAFLHEHHEKLGARVLTSWNIGADAVRVARYHHAPQSASPSDAYWMLAVLSAEVAEGLAPGTDLTAAGHHASETIDGCLAGLGLAGATVDALPESLRREYSTILATLA